MVGCRAVTCHRCLQDYRPILATFRCPRCGEEAANREALKHHAWMIDVYCGLERLFCRASTLVAGFLQVDAADSGYVHLPVKKEHAVSDLPPLLLPFSTEPKRAAPAMLGGAGAFPQMHQEEKALGSTAPLVPLPVESSCNFPRQATWAPVNGWPLHSGDFDAERATAAGVAFRGPPAGAAAIAAVQAQLCNRRTFAAVPPASEIEFAAAAPQRPAAAAVPL